MLINLDKYPHFYPRSHTHILSYAYVGVNIGGAGSYVYDTPANNTSPTSVDSASKAEEKRVYAPKAPSKGNTFICEYVEKCVALAG